MYPITNGGVVVKKQFLAVVVLTITLLCGCSKLHIPQQQAGRIVTGITVMYENESVRFFRRYTTDEKIQNILAYLRLMDPKGAAQTNPETLPGGLYTITLLYADGNSLIYRQKNNNYLQEGNGKWKNIDPKKAEWLSQLIGKTESDFN